MKWVIYYTDGSTYSNEDGEPADAPGGGVLAIAQEDATVGVLVHYGCDWYAFGEKYGGWAGMDSLGIAQYVIDAGPLVLKLGKGMPTYSYSKILREIQADPRLPEKNARYPWEFKP